MKNKRIYITLILIITLIFLVLKANAQDVRFTLNLETGIPDRNTHTEQYEYAFNLGGAIEYQMSITYFGAEIYLVPELNDKTYLHLQGTILGFNKHFNYDTWRVYLGAIKPGLIFRDQGTYPMIGFDGGFERYFNDWYIGLDSGIDYKTDDKLWNSDEGHVVWYSKFKIGIVL